MQATPISLAHSEAGDGFHQHITEVNAAKEKLTTISDAKVNRAAENNNQLID